MAKKSKLRFSKQQRWAVDDLEDYLDERDTYQTAREPRRGPRQGEPGDGGHRRELSRERRVPEWGLT